MKLQLAYGRDGLALELPDGRSTVVEPVHQPGLADERHAVVQALRHPIAAPALRDSVRPTDRVCVVFTDSTRATPNERLIPWLLEELGHVPPSQFILLNSTGTHRPNSPEELARMLGPEVLARYRVVNHDARDTPAMIPAGTMRDGTPAWLNRHLVEADVRIITGFIEPHFFAGFSGGPKGIIPGCAGLASVMANHRPANIASPRATFGVTNGNPLWEELRDVALRLQPAFLLNVALNPRHQITGVFAGDLLAAHQAGIGFVRASAMRRVDAPFDIVVTTNSGHPLDLNLYQGVKGLSAAARIVKPGGAILLACECSEGVPAGSPFEQLLRSATTPNDLLARLATSPEVLPEQWQVQIQVQIQQHARVWLHSRLPDDTVRACHLNPCHDATAWVRERLQEAGPGSRVAVLPYGPLTIPYVTADAPAAGSAGLPSPGGITSAAGPAGAA